MLSRKMIGVFRVRDPDDLLSEPTYGFIMYDPIDTNNSILWTSGLSNPPNINWDKMPVLKDAIYLK